MKRKLVILATLVAMLSAVFMPGVAAAQQQRNGLLSEIPVAGTLEDGGTFEGILSITGFAIEEGQLLVSGVLEGTATDALGTVTEITQTFTDIPASLLGDGAQGACDILFLDLGPLFLDLLGLTVDLSQITLDVNAVPGAGNLLGNLLCAVVGLLDNGGPLAGINNLLNRINDLLG